MFKFILGFVFAIVLAVTHFASFLGGWMLKGIDVENESKSDKNDTPFLP